MNLRKFRLSILCLMISGFFIFSGCHIYSFKGGDTGTATSFSVAFFKNEASIVNPSLSQSFSEALKDKFIRETRLNLVKDTGDYSLSGSITDYSVNPVSIQGNEQAQLNRLTIRVNVNFENKTDSKKSYKAQFSQYADFEATKSLAAVESSLVDDIISKLVQDIFNRTLNDW